MAGKFDPGLRDKAYWQALQDIISENQLSHEFISENCPTFTMRRHLAQYLAYYDLFMKVVDLPGCIAEFGVYWGAGLFTWLDLMELFIPVDRGRKVYGFDDFNGYTDRPSSELDVDAIDFIKKTRSDFKSPSEVVKKLIEIKNLDNVLLTPTCCTLRRKN